MITPSAEEGSLNYWLVGAVIDGVDQVDRFVREGIYENGNADKYIDKVKSLLLGDKIAIKTTYTRSKGLPFDNHGNVVSCMSIKAIGTVTANAGDGRRISVDWELLDEPLEWYFYTHRSTIWKVKLGSWASDALIRFVFEGQPQDLGRFINHPYWFDRYGDFSGKSVYRFGWTRFYATVADNLLAYRSKRSLLLKKLHRIGSRLDGFTHLKDKFPDGSTGPFQDICPFTVMGIFNRGISEKSRKVIASEFKSLLKFGEDVPSCFDGIPTLNNMSSRFFWDATDRGDDDIDILWDVFYKAIRFADGGDDYDPSEFIEAYNRASAVQGIGWNLTMGLFWIRPWAFPTLDEQSRNYITGTLGIDIPMSGVKGRCTAEEYLQVKSAIESMLQSDECSVNSFPELSAVAWGRESSSDVELLVRKNLPEFKDLVLRSFPSFQNVSNPSFCEEEINYKREASREVREMLAPDKFMGMIDAGKYAELIKILRSAGSKTNFLYMGTPTKGDLAPLCNAYPDEESLCRAFYELIWGDLDSVSRLEKFYKFVAEAELPVKWATATYYLFLLHPDTEMFVKPGVVKWLLNFFSLPMQYETKPSGRLYGEILSLCSELAAQLSGWGVSDMIDVHSLIWVAYRAPAKEVAVAEPKEVYELNADSIFCSRTFELLAMLHKDPTKEFYAEYIDEFKEFLRDPMKRLFSEIAASMPEEFGEYLETSRKLFSRIPKNDWGKGGAWDFYWGAFYKKSEKRITSDQLYMTVNQDGIEFGYSPGENREVWLREFLGSGAPVVKQIGESLSLIPELKYSVPDSSEPGSVNVYSSFTEWIENIDTAVLSACVSMSADEVLSLSFLELKERVAQVFTSLFPLMLRDTVAISTLFDSADEDEELAVNPALSLDEIYSSTGYDRNWIGRAVAALHDKGQCVFYGPPGTGKTFLAEKIADHIIGDGCGFCDMVQFHPSYSYEDFIEGLRPVAASSGVLEYKLVSGRFKEFCSRARLVTDPCVLIVDEINRANLSRVFGELMYLLEYRGKEILLAGSNEKFSIPLNVFIIGTMNTADRSIALVDHALRRRFAFIQMKPYYSVLGHYHASTGFDTQGLVRVLERVNKEIGDRNYFIGVSFFLKENISSSISNVWQLEIEPYLEEYFFDRPDVVSKFKWEAVQKEITGLE